MKRLAVIINILAFVVISVFAASSANNSADSLYAKGLYKEAILRYNEVLRNDGVSGELFYNLGNAYYKNGNIGQARLCYEKAALLLPRNKEIQNNLEYIASQVSSDNMAAAVGANVEPIPDDYSIWQSLHKSITGMGSDFWAILGVIAFLLFLVCLSLYILIKAVVIKKIGFFGAIAELGLSIVFIIFSFMSRSTALSNSDCVVISQEILLKEKPDETAKTVATPLSAGTLLKIIETTEADSKDWTKVYLNPDYVGWVKKIDVESVSL